MRFLGCEQQREENGHSAEGVDPFVTGVECNQGLLLRFYKDDMVECH